MATQFCEGASTSWFEGLQVIEYRASMRLILSPQEEEIEFGKPPQGQAVGRPWTLKTLTNPYARPSDHGDLGLKFEAQSP